MNDKFKNWYDNTIRYVVSEGLIASEDWKLLVTNFEGLRLQSYRDHTGVWTIGYGHTLGVKAGQTITEERANELLAVDVKRFEAAVNRRVTAPLTQYQFDALVSFTFNLGYGQFTEDEARILRLINSRQYTAAVKEFMRWTFADGVDCKIKSNNCYGLAYRRKAEELMFAGLDWRRYKEHI